MASLRPHAHAASTAVAALAIALLLPSRAPAADHAGTWVAAGMTKAKLCTGGRCLSSPGTHFSGELRLARDGTYRITGQTCPGAGWTLPDELGTWSPARRGRVAFVIQNVAEVEAALRVCFRVDSLTLPSTRGSIRLGSGSRGCRHATSDARDQQLCGLRTVKGRAVAGGKSARFQTVSRFTALREPAGGLCGDGNVDAGEDCDDGNLSDTDDCTIACRPVCRPEPVTDTWAGIRTRIFVGHQCTNLSCHGGQNQAGLDLRFDAAYANLATRIVPGSPQQSLLWRKVAKGALGGFDDVPGAGMPIGAAPLSNAELEAIRLWIVAGAPESGLVPQTDTLLSGCAADTPPPPVEAPPVPAAGEGIQLYAPPWTIPPHGEDEVCYPTYYDVSNRVPPEFQVPCPVEWGGPGKTCFYYNRTSLTQSANSHHSIIHVYGGSHDVSDGSFGRFTCHGGAQNGAACDPKKPGVSAPAGADCGAGGACAGDVVSSVACIGYGPPDFAVDIAGIGGSQESRSSLTYPPGVFSVLPVRGVVVWNSHAFNLGGQPTTNEQWFNLYFAAAADRKYPALGIFNIGSIFVQSVPPFKRVEYCSTQTLPRGARVATLGSHTHKRGALFRIWGPGITPCSPGPGCDPEPGAPLAQTTRYTHPINYRFDPPLELTAGTDAGRTFKYCALYDNGYTDPTEVRRASKTPPNGSGCYGQDLVCLDGPKRGTYCGGNDRRCDSRRRRFDGACDACTLRGGVTTEDEMFILIGTYYCPEGSECFTPAP